MNDKVADQESYRSFQLMSEIENGEAVSQRELANRLGIAVGLVNSYLKNFVAKGYVRIKAFPRNRYGYLLTPKGLAEKSRLAYQHLSYFNSLYKTARQDYAGLFACLATRQVEEVAFCGVDEVAEIAFLSLRETRIKVGAVFAPEPVDGGLFQQTILPLAEVATWSRGPLIITVAKEREHLYETVRQMNTVVPIYCPGIGSVE